MTTKKNGKIKKIHLLFIEHYLDCFDVGVAVERTGCHWADATQYNRIGRSWLRRPEIAEHLEKRLIEGLSTRGVTKGRVLTNIAIIANFDIRRLYDENGNLLQPHELDDETARCVSSIEVERQRRRGEDEDIETDIHKYKTHSSFEANKLLGQHLQVWGNAAGEERKDRLQEIVDALRAPVSNTPDASPPPRRVERDAIPPPRVKDA